LRDDGFDLMPSRNAQQLTKKGAGKFPPLGYIMLLSLFFPSPVQNHTKAAHQSQHEHQCQCSKRPVVQRYPA